MALVLIFSNNTLGAADSWIIAAMEYAINHDLFVTNNSYGGYTFNSAQQTISFNYY
jgi:hypothetical protein